MAAECLLHPVTRIRQGRKAREAFYGRIRNGNEVRETSRVVDKESRSYFDSKQGFLFDSVPGVSHQWIKTLVSRELVEEHSTLWYCS